MITRFEKSEAVLDFETFAREQYAALFQFALRLAGRFETAQDLTQQTFYLALKNAAKLREKSRLKQWMFTILYREFLQKRRHNQRFPKFDLDSSICELPVVQPEVERSDAHAVLACLNQLEEPFQTPLRLFYLDQLSYEQIATKLRLPIGTVMSRLSRGKKLLREMLECGTCQKSRGVRPGLLQVFPSVLANAA